MNASPDASVSVDWFYSLGDAGIDSLDKALDDWARSVGAIHVAHWARRVAASFIFRWIRHPVLHFTLLTQKARTHPTCQLR